MVERNVCQNNDEAKRQRIIGTTPPKKKVNAQRGVLNYGGIGGLFKKSQSQTEDLAFCWE